MDSCATTSTTRPCCPTCSCANNRGSDIPKLLGTCDCWGTFGTHETYSIRIFTEHSSTGSWTELQEGEVVYVNGKPYSAGGSSNSANLSASGNTFTTSFDNSGSKGTLK